MKIPPSYKMILTVCKVGQPNGSSILIYINAMLCLSLNQQDVIITLLIITQKQTSKTSSTPILHCTKEINMGVAFDAKLSFRNYISMSINKANRLLEIIIRSFCALDNTSFTLLFKAIVQPHLEYAATIRNPYKKGYMDDLEKAQCRATKLLQNISHLSYPERLAAQNLPTLGYRRIRDRNFQDPEQYL